MSEHLVGYTVAKASVEPGRYRAVSGTEAIAWGLIAGMRGAGIEKMIFAATRSRPPRCCSTPWRASRRTA